MLDIDTFRALCKKVTEEKDCDKLQLLKERMRLLSADSEPDKDHSPHMSVN
jgi:hypothetical protein